MDFTVLKIEEALQAPADTVLNISGKVLSTGEIIKYKNKANAERRYMTFIIADETTYTPIRCYLMKKQTVFIPGASILLQNVLRKTGEEPIWVVSSSKVVEWVNIEVPDDIQKEALHPKKKNDAVTPLARALISPAPSTIVGKILQASPLKHKRSGELPTRFLKLKDEQDGPCVKLALFGEDALQDYSQGDVLSITDTYRWKTTSTLSTKRSSKIEFMPPESVDVTLDNYNLDTDPDFQEDSNNSSDAQEFSVLGIQTANIYQCCPHTGCRHKKIENDVCPSCRKASEIEKFYSNAVIVLKRDTSFLTIKLFEDELKNLFDLPTINGSTDLKKELLQQLPVNAKGIFSNSGLKVISRKRKNVS